MSEILSKVLNSNILNYIKLFLIPFLSFLFLTNNFVIFALDLTVIPSHELLVMVFMLILLLNVSSIIPYFDKSNFNFFFKHFNHWVTVFITIINRILLTAFLFILAILTINMIYMEFEFGTIFVAKTNWEYSWILKFLLLYWIFLVIFNSTNSLKSLLLPFSKNQKK